MSIHARFHLFLSRDARLKTPQVIEEVKDLLGDHPDLLEGFNQFLPPGFSATHSDDTSSSSSLSTDVSPPPRSLRKSDPEESSSEAPKSQLTFNDAVAFVSDVKAAYQDEPEKYHRFLEILEEFQRSVRQDRNIPGVIAEVKTLFADRPDLVKRFWVFLPDGYEEDIANDENYHHEVENFKNQVFEALKDDDARCEKFLHLVGSCQSNMVSQVEAEEIAEALFGEHSALLLSFKKVLPKLRNERPH
eukprot:TRINITY_DN2598_c0_g1_i2.p2 TRINITY_DN2598_c0_g1~~TRINITY_DN2598_c0_g1_i2.p2  ORF type:complete len:246 (-),score=59.38 TRINITY_DN2598_c0_g1_i2:33-770(-)